MKNKTLDADNIHEIYKILLAIEDVANLNLYSALSQKQQIVVPDPTTRRFLYSVKVNSKLYFKIYRAAS